MKRALVAAVLITGLLGSVGASAEIVTRTYGVGNIDLPLCTEGDDSVDGGKPGCQFLVTLGTDAADGVGCPDLDPGTPVACGPGCAQAPGSTICAKPGDDVLVSTFTTTIRDPVHSNNAFQSYVVVEEDTDAGTVRIPPGSRSGIGAAQIIRNCVPSINDCVTITVANSIFFDGATGVGSPTNQIVWNNPVPYDVGEGCQYCEGEAFNTSCAALLLIDNYIVCGQLQAGDPELRDMPVWISDDGGDSWHMPKNGRPGDPNPLWYDQSEGLVLARSNLGTINNTNPGLFFGYLERECGTMNSSQSLVGGKCKRTDGTHIGNCVLDEQCNTLAGDICDLTVVEPYGNPFNPRHSKPDQDCDGKVSPGVFPLVSDIFDPEYPDPITAADAGLVEDVCVRYQQTSDADTDGDGRGDQCSCGDENGDGTVSVLDITKINEHLFNPAPPPLCSQEVSEPCSLCDGNGDGECDVSDLTQANNEIFSEGNTSICDRNPVVSTP